MNVWLLKISGVWIEPGQKKRLYRVNMLAEALASRGHHVTWFNSVFDDVKKCNRDLVDGELRCNEYVTIKGLQGCTYTKSRSFCRLLHHRQTAMSFRRLAVEQQPPDLIYSSWPTIDLAWEGVRYARAHNIPMVMDIRDLWPEVVADVAPGLLRPLVRMIFHPYYKLAKRALRESTVVIGITSGMLQWALDFANRKASDWDRVFPLGYLETQAPCENGAGEQYWKERDVRGGPDQFVVCYPGVFSKRLDLQTVVAAARILHEKGEKNIKFVLCGRGDLEDALRTQAAGLNNVMFPGWVEHSILNSLMPKCSVGLFPYPPRFDFVRNLPNKFFEYIAKGLPIVSCLEGDVQRQIEENACGVMYRAHDPRDLARVLCAVRDNPQRRATMANNARSLARRFDAERIYADLVSLFEEIVSVYPGVTSDSPQYQSALRTPRVAPITTLRTNS